MEPIRTNSHAVFYRETGNYRKTQIFPAKTACLGKGGTIAVVAKQNAIDVSPASSPEKSSA
jgi:hypothetical protein